MIIWYSSRNPKIRTQCLSIRFLHFLLRARQSLIKSSPLTALIKQKLASFGQHNRSGPDWTTHGHEGRFRNRNHLVGHH